MNSVIERVTKAIQGAALTHPFAQIGDMDAIFEMSGELAQAAIEALGVVVLEEGAEPEKGDLVLLVTSTIAGVPEGCSGVARDYITVQGTFQDMLNYFCSGAMEYESHKIIQRQGKPVIMEGKDDRQMV